MPAPLLPSERQEFNDACATVRRGLRAFLEAGRALEVIRTKQLYRETHRTFEQFAQEEFGLTDRRLHQLIESTKIVESLKTISPNVPVPVVEAAVRPLAGLSPVDQAEAYLEAVEEAEGEAPSPRQVREAADKRRAPKKGKARLPKPVRLRVPGATVLIIGNKAFESTEAALVAALDQVRRQAQKAA